MARRLGDRAPEDALRRPARRLEAPAPNELAEHDPHLELCERPAEAAAHAARNEEFREEFATRQRAMRERLVKVYERWSQSFPVSPPLPLEDIAAMTFFMADGFLVNRLIESELSEELYTKMLSVFFAGLEAMAAARAT